MRALALGNGPTVVSKATPWAGLQLEVHHVLPRKLGAASGPPDGEQGLLITLEGTTEIHPGPRGALASGPGSVTFLSGRYPRFVERIEGGSWAAAIKVDEVWFHRLGLDGPPTCFGLTSAGPDPTTLHLVRAIIQEVQSGGGSGRLFAESLSVALLSYVLQDMARHDSHVPRGGLSGSQANRIRDYIAEHLAGDVSLAELAALVGMTPRRFTEAFRHSFGMTPHRYVVRQRVGSVMDGLRESGVTLEALAKRVGFSNASHLSRAFRAVTGTSPRRYARDRNRRGRSLVS